MHAAQSSNACGRDAVFSLVCVCAMRLFPLYVQVQLPEEIRDFVRASTGNYGKVKLVLQRNKFFVESAYPDVLRRLVKVPDACFNFFG